MSRLLIVDDNESVRRQLKWGLSKESYDLLLAQDADEALRGFESHRPEVVTLDLGLPPDPDGSSEGFRCLEAMLRLNPAANVIVVTGHHDRENALRAIQAGAYDFCRKPVDLAELKVIINRAFYLSTLQAEADAGERNPEPAPPGHPTIVGDCPAMRKVFATIEKVAGSDAPVLIMGESGTGKEVVARAIHDASRRKAGPLVAVNCGAIPEHLLESEFFGHEKGAFTGATNKVLGKVEYADGGTLFLDEVGELPLNMQVKLLRFLQEMVIQRVGGRKDIAVNTRIVAATNVDIAKAMEEGAFRVDLYYRIGVVTLTLPPLRERGDDIPLLAEHFLKRMSGEQQVRVTGFSAAAERALRAYAWPGNVRELENKIRRAVILTGSPRIDADDLGLDPETVAESVPDDESMTLKEARNAVEREMVQSALRRNAGNILQAAKAIGVSRPTFYDLMKKHGIES